MLPEELKTLWRYTWSSKWDKKCWVYLKLPADSFTVQEALIDIYNEVKVLTVRDLDLSLEWIAKIKIFSNWQRSMKILITQVWEWPHNYISSRLDTGPVGVSFNVVHENSFLFKQFEFIFSKFFYSPSFVVLCGIWYYSYNFKIVKNTHGGVLLLV